MSRHENAKAINNNANRVFFASVFSSFFPCHDVSRESFIAHLRFVHLQVAADVYDTLA